ncbi:hypothetical protein V8B55DRAFT_1044493 [Mucor lusitanicus]
MGLSKDYIMMSDIFEGEGRKYALAAVEHVIENLEEDQKLLIMYSIMTCITQRAKNA